MKRLLKRQIELFIDCFPPFLLYSKTTSCSEWIACVKRKPYKMVEYIIDIFIPIKLQEIFVALSVLSLGFINFIDISILLYGKAMKMDWLCQSLKIYKKRLFALLYLNCCTKVNKILDLPSTKNHDTDCGKGYGGLTCVITPPSSLRWSTSIWKVSGKQIRPHIE